MMTVADLFEKLQQMPRDATVFVGDDDNLLLEVIEVAGHIMLITDEDKDEEHSRG
jgi:hypothetical protein